MVELYSLDTMTTFPYAEDFGIDGPDGDPIYGKDAQRAWKEYYSSDSDSSDEEKPEKRGCKWCKEMIKIYGLTQMTTFPYAEDFGIDGPDGDALWGGDAEECFKDRYHPWCMKMVETYGAEQMVGDYAEDFGIDGPDGEAYWGKKAKRLWKYHRGGKKA